jgi:hypothetical protein
MLGKELIGSFETEEALFLECCYPGIDLCIINLSLHTMDQTDPLPKASEAHQLNITVLRWI